MHADWHAGGKGPAPDVVALDNEMDSYFKNKPTATAAAAADSAVLATANDDL